MILHEALLEVVFGAVEDAKEVAAAHTAVYAKIGVLQAEINERGLTDLDNVLDELDQAIGALYSETMEAAWLAGWTHAKRPELLIFSDAVEDPEN